MQNEEGVEDKLMQSPLCSIYDVVVSTKISMQENFRLRTVISNSRSISILQASESRHCPSWVLREDSCVWKNKSR